jgi:prenyltransferase beta subunit
MIIGVLTVPNRLTPKKITHMKKIYTLLFIISPAFVFSQTTVRAKTITLRRFLEQQHYKPVQWNDTSSAMLYDKWIKELDEEKQSLMMNCWAKRR